METGQALLQTFRKFGGEARKGFGRIFFESRFNLTRRKRDFVGVTSSNVIDFLDTGLLIRRSISVGIRSGPTKRPTAIFMLRTERREVPKKVTRFSSVSDAARTESRLNITDTRTGYIRTPVDRKRLDTPCFTPVTVRYFLGQ